MIIWSAPHRQMERMKRELRRFTATLGGGHGVRVCGLPAVDDLEAQVRLEALVSLLEAHGSPVRFGGAAAGNEATVWLGDGDVEPGGRLTVLWPRPDAAGGEVLEAIARSTGGHSPRGGAVVLAPTAARARAAEAAGFRAVPLPDVAHALWGLLDHHPRGDAGRVLALDGYAGDLLPSSRVKALDGSQALLARGLAPAGLVALWRRRLIEAARRGLTAHAEVEADGIGPSILAALVGRGIRMPGGGGAAAAAYWREWSPEEEQERLRA